MCVELDYENRPVTVEEGPDTIIKVWEVSPSEAEYDYYWIRGWQDMLNFVRSEMERMLEGSEQDGLSATIGVKLVEVTKMEYEEVQEFNV